MNMDMLSRGFDILQRAGGMEQISQLMVIVYGVLCVFGLLNCILGYRILRFWMMIFGFIIGAGAGFGVTYMSGVQDQNGDRRCHGGTGDRTGCCFVSDLQGRNLCTGIWYRNNIEYLSGPSDQFFFLFSCASLSVWDWEYLLCVMRKE